MFISWSWTNDPQTHDAGNWQMLLFVPPNLDKNRSSVSNVDLAASHLVLNYLADSLEIGHWGQNIPPLEVLRVVQKAAIVPLSSRWKLQITVVLIPGANSCISSSRHVLVSSLSWPRWIVKRPWMQRLSLSLLMRDSAVGHTPLHMSQMINYIAFHDSLTPRDV